MDANSANPIVSSERQSPLPGARLALILLLSINLFNYIDRYVLAAVLPRIETDLLPGDPDAKGKLGTLTMAFLVTYMLIAPFFGWLADRMSRWLIVGLGVIFWSLASGASGLAESFVVLLLTRCLIGVGEAAYVPVAPTMISDLYPVAVRGRVLSWFFAAIPVGAAIGYALGGIVADTAFGWRWAFYLVVAPGLLLGLWCFLMPEPPAGQADAVAASRRLGLKDYRILLRTPSYVLDTLGMTAMTFVVGGVGVFMPTFFYEREASFLWTIEAEKILIEKHQDASPELLGKLKPLAALKTMKTDALKQQLSATLTPAEMKRYLSDIEEAAHTSDSPQLSTVTTIFGGILLSAGLVATLLGGIAGDALRLRWSGSYFLVSAAGMFVGFPLFLLALWTPLPFGWAFMFLSVFFLFFNTGPTNTILANVTHPSLRATGFAVNIFVIHILGDVISPPIIGMIADRSNLGTAFFVVSFIILVSGGIWLCGAKYLERDTRLAPRLLDSTDTPKDAA